MSKKTNVRNMLLRYQKERQKNVLAKPGEHQFLLVLDHLKPGFNVPKIFRSAEAFGAAGIHLVDIGPFDPAPAKGSFRKVPATFHDDFESCYQQLREDGYQLFRLAPDAEESLCNCQLPEKSAFILGHEEFGCSFEPAEFPAIRSLSIPQYGSVQSLNVSVASSVVMYEYVRQFQPES
ncbi:tRNA (guanosine-2'-O-)-methyltransferase [Malonomonas rubra DSM 5091]|uniref:tRNA (Guanosine-2'-O-)-methyltransferase n=1 Tax=Malonomonas rubra DSM 5091 TaxID=1122189 RepID=A0A1M6IUI3_MALRU|nr:TrmH family RNA methyltransferase [Malonomonas rubra]SHJ38117.1 tRNA (guanosine-2'-O-)-methyltransferase [Malonomonas rubra DSM 5091]